ncbi:MAG: Stp1/IreP family PP2C-type Ser/Thr phosphatase [Clostridia bacterium]|nr:Stp1/IreP family PP2C-type Ser/Thr phosphatase [Clostridia bacterium]MBQ3461516.1 Stp1/IreP family PP2C-type Ser/Thr phosphatase [Clostridia bacterium]MBQ6558451.1 Stp1/IreP family PP2C-type Ser/Thr phosphatase [Clostridia bacterium]MBQ9600374.1 Stp1/IreP family PP2C-type Ser/Thr phosphatase [Clostridia bacterium]MBR0027389.1 Stp1/IreP family PP2C-type Ser/Thr phosphatase [Clostridia bacterium]
MQYGAITDIGQRRKINEDNYYIHDDDKFPYAIVADGMGGHQAGEVASMMVVDIIESRLSQDLKEGIDYVEAGEVLRQAFISANSIIYNYAKDHYKIMGMGTTTTMALIYGGRVITAHVGDSRAYAAGEEIVQLTKDHSYVQELVSRGEISPEMAKHHPRKNYITRAMGAEDTVKVDISIKPYNGETIVLSSDGLTNYVDDEEILAHIKKFEPLQTACEKLMQLANERGGSDNITVVAFRKEDE